MKSRFNAFLMSLCITASAAMATASCYITGDLMVQNLTEYQVDENAALFSRGRFSLMQTSGNDSKKILIFESASDYNFSKLKKMSESSDTMVSNFRENKGTRQVDLKKLKEFAGSCSMQLCEVASIGTTVAALAGADVPVPILFAGFAVHAMGAGTRALGYLIHGAFPSIAGPQLFYVSTPNVIYLKTGIADQANFQNLKQDLAARLSKQENADFQFVMLNGKLEDAQWREISKELNLQQLPVSTFREMIPKDISKALKPDSILADTKLAFRSGVAATLPISKIVLQSAEVLTTGNMSLVRTIIEGQGFLVNDADIKSFIKTHNVHMAFVKDLQKPGSTTASDEDYPVALVYEDGSATKIAFWRRFGKDVQPELTARITATINANIGKPYDRVLPTLETDHAVFRALMAGAADADRAAQASFESGLFNGENSELQRYTDKKPRPQ